MGRRRGAATRVRRGRSALAPEATSPDGRHYYPALPYTSYQRITLDDARDLFAYLKTLPAVQGKVRDHDVPFPFNIRRALGG